MKNLLTRAYWTVAILIAVYGLWYSVSTVRNHNSLVSAAQAETVKAKADLHEVHEILAGRLAMRTEGKEYYEFARIKWTAAKHVGK
ncbi:MAG: hypothetical protein A2143_02270 [Gallionellales bacterium RBG_16_57_15]|nr:MAG: hypothetical protein A2143_02270 [Gallionellales bacterium RBG_16_57_15]